MNSSSPEKFNDFPSFVFNMAQRRDDNLVRQVADRVRELRKARGMGQEAVYEDTGVHIKKIEAKGSNLTITSVAILCEYFDISLEEFFKGVTHSKNLNL